MEWERAGPKRGEEVGRPFLCLGPVGFSGFFPISLFSLLVSFPNTLKLFEFKHKFEFKSYALNQNKTMHQHECTNIFNLEKI